MSKDKFVAKPDWLKAVYNPNSNYKNISGLLQKYRLNTVCDAANCPNSGECYNNGTATFMLMGKYCTRNCTFCNVEKASPEEIDKNEPQNIANAVAELKLKHVVITSVTRDDLPDGGAAHFASTVRHIRDVNKDVTVEVLIPDFLGDIDSLQTIIDARPEVINHNIETIARLYKSVRPMAVYSRSLELLARVKNMDKTGQIATKSGFMAGLGETEQEVIALLKDLREADCDIVTIGQYLRPSKKHYPVFEYVHPDIFNEYKSAAYGMGFKYVASGPFVRSSYNAHEEIEAIRKG